MVANVCSNEYLKMAGGYNLMCCHSFSAFKVVNSFIVLSTSVPDIFFC